MKRILQVVLIILSAFYLVSCNADPKGLVSSSDVNKRFEDSSNLPGKADVMLAEGEEFSFIVVADTHVYHGSDSRLSLLKARLIQDKDNGVNDKFLIACGDISQCGEARDFQAFKAALEEPDFPVYTAIGNHDLYFDGWHNYREILGESFYTFKAGPAANPVLFVCFDSANGTLGRKQKNWLEGVLKSNTQPLVVVFTHFELFSPNPKTIQQYTDIEEIAFLVNLFGKTGVDYVFMGHSHDYYDKVIDNRTHYVNVPGFVDKEKYLRVTVKNGTISCGQPISLKN